VYLTMNPDLDLAIEAFRRGASGYVLKTCTASELVTAIRLVLCGKSYLSPVLKGNANLLDRQQKSVVADKGERLTARQREVLQLLAEGKTVKEIGFLLKLTPRTVCFHKYRVMELLGFNKHTELVRFALRNGVVAASR
jgi:DNA-binding NarL/FixJ family response regulator